MVLFRASSVVNYTIEGRALPKSVYDEALPGLPVAQVPYQRLGVVGCQTSLDASCAEYSGRHSGAGLSFRPLHQVTLEAVHL